MTQFFSFGNVVKSIFEAWKEANIECLVLRNYQQLPEYVGNDIDILVRVDQEQQAETLVIETMTSHGFALYNRAEFSCISLFFYQDDGSSLHIDLFTELTWRGFPLLSSRLVFANKVPIGLFNIPHPVHEAIVNLLTGLMYQGHVRDKYKTSILVSFANQPQMAFTYLAKLFGNAVATKVVHDILDQQWSRIEAYRHTLRKVLVMRNARKRPIKTLHTLLSNGTRLIRRLVRPPGLFIVLLGPDGCGKTTLAHRLLRNVGPKFFKDLGLYIHWKPNILTPSPESEVQTNTTPHGKRPRNRIVSILYFAYHVVTFILGANLRIRPIIFGNGVVVVDRYYYDFLIDPWRYRLVVPKRVIQEAQRFIMTPDLVLCLDAPTAILRSRKTEVSTEETNRQRIAYRYLAKAMANCRFVDASQSPEEVELQTKRLILDYMAKRTSRYLQGVEGSS